jgi:hypothetical protein
MPLKMSEAVRAGCVMAYAKDKVLPQLPPNTCHFSTPKWHRNISMSDT